MKEYQNIVFHHQMPAQLRFSDVDSFGHINNSIYFSLFDMCKTQYFMNVWGKDVFKKISTVIVNIEAKFLSPIYYPDEIDIQTAITKMGNKSFTVYQRAINRRTKSIKCECETVMVAVDAQNSNAIRIPDEYRKLTQCVEDSVMAS